GLFERDFTLTPPTHANESSMTIDHVALALAADQLDTWVLFAKAVLDMEAGESLDLADPFGLVRSRGAANAGRTMRFVLNVSISERTRTAQAVRAGGGVTVHHVAFATDDLFASVERLRALGAVFIPISPNYYDDLVARLDLDAPFAERLRAQGVLFDRDDGGDYLHVYAEVAQGTLLIELVQRIGDYDGYGAANAPVRMASQAQRTA
ncbi:MAG TPA: VOC family protein, partial [Paraburkholderia sp.]